MNAGTRLDSLTGLRFFAAAAVVVFHADGAFGDKTAGWAVGGGYLGVTFFFVLSGFVLTWSAGDRAVQAGRFWWHRFARIWPLHALTAVVALLLLSDPDPWIIAANLGLVHAWHPSPDVKLSLNGASWSLSAEAFFYVAFPLLLVWASRVRRYAGAAAAVTAGMVAVYVVVLSAGAAPHWVNVLPAYRIGEFVIGVLLARAVRDGRRPPTGLRAATALTALAYLWIVIVFPSGQLGVPADLRPLTAWLMVPPFALLIATAARADLERRPSPFRHRSCVRLGEWSFALYLAQGPVISALSRADIASPVAAMLTCCGALAAAAVLHHWFERPVERWLRRLPARRERRMRDPAPEPAPA